MFVDVMMDDVVVAVVVVVVVVKMSKKKISKACSVVRLFVHASQIKLQCMGDGFSVIHESTSTITTTILILHRLALVSLAPTSKQHFLVFSEMK